MEYEMEAGQDRRVGFLAVALIVIVLPLLVAYFFAAWSLALAAWHLMRSQIG